MASSGVKPKLEELLAGIPDASLDGRISNAHLETIARSLKSWREVAPYLGLTEAEEEDINNDNRRHRNQKSAALRKWRKKAGAHATYRKLASAFHECGLADTIDAIRDVINAPTPAFPPTNTPPKRCISFRWLWIMGAFIVLVVSIVVYWLLLHSGGAPIANCPPTSLTLKAPTEHFVGRNSVVKETIRSLHNFSVVNIVGPPGFGKSALAISVGHQLRNEGKTIIYIDMNEVSDSHNLKQWILDGAGVPHASSDGMVNQNLQKWASKVECPIVIILDGCDAMFHESKDDFYRVVQKLVESTHHMKILTTSRQSLVHPNAHAIKLQELSLPTAMVLLRKIHPSLNHTQRKLIANATGGVPLALVVIGALLNRAYASTPDKVISDLQDKNKFFKTLNHPDMLADFQIDGCIEYSYKFLDRQLQILAQILANFPATFTATAACYCADTAGNGELNLQREKNRVDDLHILNLTESDCKERLKELVMRSLLEFDMNTQRYKLQKLIRKFFLQRQDKQVKLVFQTRFMKYYSELAWETLPDLLSEKANILHAHDILYEHMNASYALHTKKATQITFLVAENVDWSLLRTSLLKCSERVYWICAILLRETFERLSSSSTVLRAAVLPNLFSFYSNYTDNEYVLEVIQQLGDDVYSLLMAMSNSELLGTQTFNEILVPLQEFYIKLGQPGRAYKLYEKNLEVWKAGGTTMSLPLVDATIQRLEQHLWDENVGDEATYIIDALLEHKRREIEYRKEKKYITEEEGDVEMRYFLSLRHDFSVLSLLLTQTQVNSPRPQCQVEIDLECVWDEDLAPREFRTLGKIKLLAQQMNDTRSQLITLSSLLAQVKVSRITLPQDDTEINCTSDEEYATSVLDLTDDILEQLKFNIRILEGLKMEFPIDESRTYNQIIKSLWQLHNYAKEKTAGLYFCTRKFGIRIISKGTHPPKGYLVSSAELHSTLDLYTRCVTLLEDLLRKSLSVSIRQDQKEIQVQCLFCHDYQVAEMDATFDFILGELNFFVKVLDVSKAPDAVELRRAIENIEIFKGAEVHREEMKKARVNVHYCTEITEVLPVTFPPQEVVLYWTDGPIGSYSACLSALHVLPLPQLTKISGFDDGKEEVRYLCAWDQVDFEFVHALLDSGLLTQLEYLYNDLRRERRDTYAFTVIEEHREELHLVKSKLRYCKRLF